MTKSKRMFAELLVQARGHGDPDDIAKTMSLVDIIYEMKKEELKKEVPEPEVKVEEKKEASPPSTEPEVKVEEKPPSTEEPIVEKKVEPSSPVVKIKDFWSRLTHDSDSD